MIRNPFYRYIVISLILILFGCTKEPDNIAFSSDGVEISFDSQGKGKPALVFVHGWCCDKSYWKFQVPHFSKQHKVITIDLVDTLVFGWYLLFSLSLCLA